jgi:arginase family enzyme
LGLCGAEVARWAAVAGADAAVSSFEVVEIAPCLDVDDRSSRWAAAVVWSFLRGLASRGRAQSGA